MTTAREPGAPLIWGPVYPVRARPQIDPQPRSGSHQPWQEAYDKQHSFGLIATVRAAVA